MAWIKDPNKKDDKAARPLTQAEIDAKQFKDGVKGPQKHKDVQTKARFKDVREVFVDGQERCTAAKKNGLRCSKAVVPGKRVCNVHGGGKFSGTQPGQQHGLKHGLYAGVIKTTEVASYQEALQMAPQNVAKHTAAMLVAQIRSALSQDIAADPVMRAILPALEQQVKDGTITKEQAREFITRHNAPTLPQLATSSAPMAKFLDLAAKSDEGGGFAEVMAIADARRKARKGEWED